jgi:hypothetical protein
VVIPFNRSSWPERGADFVEALTEHRVKFVPDMEDDSSDAVPVSDCCGRTVVPMLGRQECLYGNNTEL